MPQKGDTAGVEVAEEKLGFSKPLREMTNEELVEALGVAEDRLGHDTARLKTASAPNQERLQKWVKHDEEILRHIRTERTRRAVERRRIEDEELDMIQGVKKETPEGEQTPAPVEEKKDPPQVAKKKVEPVKKTAAAATATVAKTEEKKPTKAGKTPTTLGKEINAAKKGTSVPKPTPKAKEEYFTEKKSLVGSKITALPADAKKVWELKSRIFGVRVALHKSAGGWIAQCQEHNTFGVYQNRLEGEEALPYVEWCPKCQKTKAGEVVQTITLITEDIYEAIQSGSRKAKVKEAGLEIIRTGINGIEIKTREGQVFIVRVGSKKTV